VLAGPAIINLVFLVISGLMSGRKRTPDVER